MDRETPTQEKYFLMPDSFKGTMDAIEVCRIMKASILRHDPAAQVISVPIADGGEGTVDCFLHAFGGKKRTVRVTGPYGKPMWACYGRIGETAVVEMAAVSGFSKGKEGKNDPSAATTYGVGELMKAAVSDGMKKIILGLGGSCTNDGGAGMAAALGVKFYDAKGEEFIPAGKDLDRICRIDTAECERTLKGVEIEAMCDIDNPLYGPNGAACVFAPQKGADPDMVKRLDQNLRVYARRILEATGIDVSLLTGGGAAGGMGAGASALLGAELKQGIDVILDLLNFETILRECKVIFTGEGQLDRQSLGGKVVVGIARRARKAEVPVIAVVGTVKGDVSPIYDLGVEKVFQTDPGIYRSEEELKKNCRRDLERTMDRVLTQM
ncbi:glycerate kinase [Anaerovorax odorimutans]|uniref:Glycerate kinase n=1 Tax=Anaerovorax odorimutans TaxID=109327 RepID=A0ABT1RLZ3_9FIRM|nr:glycerate kinase [Anaerovorax odorimutans]MCQ4636192.1 glycerate kinase [Anaerovorax odorimutans]